MQVSVKLKFTPGIVMAPDAISITPPGYDTPRTIPEWIGRALDGSTDKGGFWSDIDAEPPHIYRLRDRVFVGNATLNHDTRSGNNNTWLSSGSVGASWAPRDAQFISMSDNGSLALVGASRTSDHDQSLASTPGCIGVAGFIINDRTGPGKAAWALYADVQHQPENPTLSFGLEIAAKNKGANYTSDPYQLTYGVIGLWLAGGGDDSYGGAPTNPSNAAMVVLSNKHTWNKGIVFSATGLTGTDGSAADTGTATAIEMARNHQIRWLRPDRSAGATIRSQVQESGKSYGILFLDTQINFFGPGGATVFNMIPVASGVNSIYVNNAAAGLSPAFRTTGADTNIDLRLEGKGTGRVQLGPYAGGSDAAITGYIEVKDHNGSLRKLAVIL